MFRLAVIAVLFFCLVGFVKGSTAKEAHDTELACIKGCAKMPSILRCERACRSTPSGSHVENKKHHKKPGKHVDVKKERKEFKVERQPVKPATRLVKGRRVILVRKH